MTATAPYLGLGLRNRQPVSARTPAPDVGERFGRMRSNGEARVAEPFKGITTDALQRYVEERSQEAGQKGNTVSHTTIQKEIGTLASLWNKWAMPQRLVAGPAPTRGLIYSKGKGKPPFATCAKVYQSVNDLLTRAAGGRPRGV